MDQIIKWNEIEKQYQHFNNDWGHYPKEFCKNEIKPSYNELFEYTQVSKDEKWLESIHPFCKSCFSIYKDVCGEVGIFFRLGKNWKKEDLSNSVNNFIIDSLDKKEEDSIKLFEQSLIPFIDCINARWFQHDNCFISYDKEINNNVQVSNDDHMMFLLILLCKEVKRLYSIYKSSIYSKNQKIIALNSSLTKKLPLDVDKFKDNQILNICRNIIKNYGKTDDKKDIDIIFETHKSKNLNLQYVIKKIKNNQEIKKHIK